MPRATTLPTPQRRASHCGSQAPCTRSYFKLASCRTKLEKAVVYRKSLSLPSPLPLPFPLSCHQPHFCRDLHGPLRPWFRHQPQDSPENPQKLKTLPLPVPTPINWYMSKQALVRYDLGPRDIGTCCQRCPFFLRLLPPSCVTVTSSRTFSDSLTLGWAQGVPSPTLCCCSVSRSHLTLCDPMHCSLPGFPFLH